MSSAAIELNARITLWMLVAGLTAAYGLVSYNLAEQGVTTFFSTESQPGIPGLTGSVPSSVLNAVETSVGQENHVADVSELLVLPGKQPGTYMVTATLDVTADSTDNRLQTASAVADFIQSVYRSGVDIEDVRVYALKDGMFIAGAGVGKDAYTHWTVSTGTGSSGSTAFILASPSASKAGMNDRWFEYTSIQ